MTVIELPDEQAALLKAKAAAEGFMGARLVSLPGENLEDGLTSEACPSTLSASQRSNVNPQERQARPRPSWKLCQN
jgi:hypothetical protein